MVNTQDAIPHNWQKRRVFICALAATPLLLLAACTSVGASTTASRPSTTVPTSTGTRTNEGGQVSIDVTWRGPTAGTVFTVAMNTHAVDLDGYDLRQLAVLRTDQGQEVQPISWEAPKGGHHRVGTLTFPSKTDDGAPLIGPQTRSLALIIRDVAGVPERIFRWVLSS